MEHTVAATITESSEFIQPGDLNSLGFLFGGQLHGHQRTQAQQGLQAGGIAGLHSSFVRRLQARPGQGQFQLGSGRIAQAGVFAHALQELDDVGHVLPL